MKITRGRRVNVVIESAGRAQSAKWSLSCFERRRWLAFIRIIISDLLLRKM